MAQKNLRAEMNKEDFFEFKTLMSELKAETNDEAILELMEHYKSPPEIEEAIEVLEEAGYEVTKQTAEEY